MNNRFLTALCFFVCTCLRLVAADSLIMKLDEAILNRELYMQRKEKRIDSLRNLKNTGENTSTEFDRYKDLFEQYLAFNSDSAMLYVNRMDNEAEKAGSQAEKALVKINRALALATSGHFSQAEAQLQSLDSYSIDKSILEKYFMACEWTYSAWAQYSDNKTISPELSARSMLYLDSLIAVTADSTPEYYYRVAEKAWKSKDYKKAEKNYLKAISLIPVDCRLYAQSTYALASTYKRMGNMPKYRQWLINAAISDQMVPLKENLAMQQLALYLRTEENDLERANSYLKLALEDAIYYNNRLRMLEIAKKIPDIANVYQATIENKNERLKILVCIIGLLVLLLTGAVAFVYRQGVKVTRAKDAFAQLNAQLKEANAQLGRTNDMREQYVSLFMDLCAAYIEKLNRFPMVLKLKVKSLNDITSVAERYVRPSEAETREMFFCFDSAFLRLYPDYISQFNSLLVEDRPILPKKGELLNTDLRIYALVRMGITDSNKIATLLFLSPQTIFNHRTQVRNRARNRETFEKEVLRICPTMPL